MMAEVAAKVDTHLYEPPQNGEEAISFANAHAYEWCYYDTCRENGVVPLRVPDGWPYAWLEHNRRATTHRIAIREGFRMWRDNGILPAL